MGAMAIVGGVARRLQWSRGLRAGFAVATAMVVCHLLGKPMGWAALGGFEAILVDNGGPYRSRLQTMGTLMLGGALAAVVGALAAAPMGSPVWMIALGCGVTAAFCFATTLARVVSQPIASTSVIVLVIYFAGYGGSQHTLAGALESALAFVLGGAWAAALSLVLWPVDPFRPTRRAVAECYGVLAAFASSVRATAPHSEERSAARLRTHDFQRRMRLTMETARGALETTAARTTARTVRARNLTVLLETADILFAESIRWTEMLEGVEAGEREAVLLDAFRWLAGAERAVDRGLEHRPQDGGASFAPEGSHSLEHVRRRAEAIRAHVAGPGDGEAPGPGHLLTEERDALQNIEIAFEAVRAVWSGSEVRAGAAAERWEGVAKRSVAEESGRGWSLRSAVVDAVRAHWTGQSLMMRHALRMGVVGGVDVLLMRLVHVSHGSWLAMTSIIVLQPYGSGTLRKSLQRVGGTIAGGVLAALLAASIHSQVGIIVVVTLTSVLTLATYAVDYGWYSFFLTPTFVLLSLPHLRDWHYAGVRMGTTVLGAMVAVAAMALLWPEREETELTALLGRGAAADAAYVRAMLRFWSVSTEQRASADRELMAPARRQCGLSINDAEEALDRMMLEPTLGRRSASGKDIKTTALTFVTYLRRLTRSVTTLEGVGTGDVSAMRRLEAVATRLEAVSALLAGQGETHMTHASQDAVVEGMNDVAEQQIRRMERQTGVMERAAEEILQEVG